ncbi:MAG: glycosyltransferase family A protein [Candidatus Margulisiibacteriota bacterium]
MPQVSVIIPTYNRLSYLKKALKSVMVQTFKDYEIIVVDDGSTDGTTSYISGLPFIRYVYQENKGVSAARNRGLTIARGEYVCFLDSDDTWKKTKLEKQAEVFQNNPGLKACYTEETWIRNGKHLNQMKKHQKYSGWIFEKALPLCIISPSSIMLKKDVFNDLGCFDENLDVCEDYDFWLRLTARYQVLFLKEALIVKYGGHKDQLSRKYWGMDIFRVVALEKMLLEYPLNDQNKKAVYKEFKYKYNVLKRGAWKRKNIPFWINCHINEKKVIFKHFGRVFLQAISK